jgi:pentatricopeptide repeat protein
MDKRNNKNDTYIYAAIMDCYAKWGNADKVLLLFNQLKQGKKIKINDTIYCIVLNACSHSGLVHEAISIFNEIKDKNTLSSKTITAMIDCVGRQNYLDEAENIYNLFCQQKKYDKLKLSMLLSILSSCRIHNDIERAQRIFNIMEKEKPDNNILAPMYILLSNIYAQNKNFVKMNDLSIEIKKKEIKKIPGISWIEINNKTHTFIANDTSHPMYNEIVKEREILKKELIQYGHIFDETVISRDLMENENIENHLCGHSEKLALIYGLIMTPKETPITIAKNLRVCKDCHNATKLISKIRNRKILIRDKNRWHIFQNGKCSCNDYF